MKFLILSICLLFSIQAFSQLSETDCEVMKNATMFKENNDSDPTSYYVVKGGYYFDYSNGGKNYVRSRIEWQDDCTYMLTLEETNIPNFEIPAGTKIRIQITAVNDNVVSYEYLPKGVLPGGEMIIYE